MPALLACLLVLAGCGGSHILTGGTPAASPAAGAIPRFDHIYLLILENKEDREVVGSAAAPYLNQLAGRYGLATHEDAVAHPSQPNYLALFSGSTQAVSNDAHYELGATNLADQLEAAQLDWRVYAENYPGNCYRGDTASGGPDGSGTYARKHDPAISFIDISGNPERCARINDFSHFDPAAAPFELIVPNLCHDMHDCSVADGDRWLADWLPGHLLNTPTWQTTDSLLLITFDEGTSNEGGGGRVATIVISKHTPAGFRSDTPHTHYSLLRTIEAAWKLPCLAESCQANDLGEFFRP